MTNTKKYKILPFAPGTIFVARKLFGADKVKTDDAAIPNVYAFLTDQEYKAGKKLLKMVGYDVEEANSFN